MVRSGSANAAAYSPSRLSAGAGIACTVGPTSKAGAAHPALSPPRVPSATLDALREPYPIAADALFLGRGFRWLPTHTQRLYLCRLPQCEHWLRTDRPSASGGDPLLHGVELREGRVTLPLRDRPGHTLVLGTTRVGKTRLAELLIAQDIRRGDTVIVFDPKGDADLLRRVWAEAHRAGRESVFWLFHLGWPEISARYNAVGRFGCISEVASRIAGQLSTEGNSAAFREFAWRFVNIITRALVALGQRPDYARIARHVINIDELFIDYAASFCPVTTDRRGTTWCGLPVASPRKTRRVIFRDGTTTSSHWSSTFPPPDYMNRSSTACALPCATTKTYFDKIVASLLPLLEKLTTGKIAQLLAPDYGDLNDPRPVFDWQQAIRQRAIVYVGLDALSDAEIAAAVGNSMFADLVSVAGHIYKHGVMDGLPQAEEKNGNQPALR
ncbi:Type IV secretory pathway VirD4 component [Salmonella enterica subsp. arizonae]|uniref:Type IV secretory pathway VirD4 component n=1 Tax=Salmonella enterica subsp. arizonae TaxID=59203 RepID=A0A379TJM6_SALER|nr:Type IV secretory pathway VirD4 component [Salmonella enterica subsp. arizonae]